MGCGGGWGGIRNGKKRGWVKKRRMEREGRDGKGRDLAGMGGGGGGGVRRDKEGLGRREKRTRNEWRATGKG